MITKNILRENLIHQKSYEARRNAINGGVYICSGSNEFTFIPLEEVMYEGMTLKEYITSTKNQIAELIKENENALRSAIQDIIKQLETHEQAIKLLADEIDKGERG